MNLIKVSIFFVIITMPFMLTSYTSARNLQSKAQLSQYYQNIVNNATDDAASVIRTSSDRTASGGEALEIDAEEVTKAFLDIYCGGFNAFTVTDRTRVSQYIMAVLILDYDGFYIYGAREVFDGSGQRKIQPILSEKQPFAYNDGAYSYQVTMGTSLTVIDNATLSRYDGEWSILASYHGAGTFESFEEWRNQIINTSVTNALEQTVTLHNRYTAELGCIYDFYLPLGEDNRLTTVTNEVGIIAFVQGQPLGGGEYLEMMALGQGAVVKEKPVDGYVDVAGQLYYCAEATVHVHTDTLHKILSSGEAAALEGYYPCYMLGK